MSQREKSCLCAVEEGCTSYFIRIVGTQGSASQAVLNAAVSCNCSAARSRGCLKSDEFP